MIDHFGSKIKTRQIDDDHFIINVEVSLSPTFFSWIFEFAGMITVLGPSKVKEQYREMLLSALEK